MFGPEVYKVPNSMSEWITFKNKYLVGTAWDFVDHMVSVATIQVYCGSKAALDHISWCTYDSIRLLQNAWEAKCGEYV